MHQSGCVTGPGPCGLYAMGATVPLAVCSPSLLLLLKPPITTTVWAISHLPNYCHAKRESTPPNPQTPLPPCWWSFIPRECHKQCKDLPHPLSLSPMAATIMWVIFPLAPAATTIQAISTALNCQVSSMSPLLSPAAVWASQLPLLYRWSLPHPSSLAAAWVPLLMLLYKQQAHWAALEPLAAVASVVGQQKCGGLVVAQELHISTSQIGCS